MPALDFNTPKDLIDAYVNGFKGSVFDPVHYEKFCSEMKYASFGAAAPYAAGSGKGKLSLPFLSVMKFCPTAFGDDRQTTGDCVSHSARNAADISRAVEIDIKGEPEEWVARGATEVTYGLRGHCGQGMSCSQAAQTITRIGMPVRKKYNGYDFTVYDSSKGARKWCPRNVPQDLLDQIKANKFETSTLIRSVEEARDAVANGYGISICSGQGFSSNRDAKGFCAARGSWSHALTIIGCDDREGNMDFVMANSWGAWNSGGQPADFKLPVGGWLAKAEVIARMIRGGGTFAFSGFDGFPLQKLPDYGSAGLYG